MNKLLLLISLLCVSFCSLGQEIAIANGSVQGCGGFLLDTGVAFSDYQNNENFTMTLCAEAPETILNLYWNSFNLGTGDSMTIYDGDDTSAPEIGVFTGTDLQTTDVTSSINGCLTLVWISDATDTGNFSAEIACGPPCIRPLVGVNIDSELPWRICVDEEIILDGSPTVFADGTSIATHTWDFGDNTTDIESWPLVTHSYSVAGAYVIQLFVVDDNNCNSGNTIDVLVEVSTTPSFAGTSGDVLSCLGSEVSLEGMVTPVEWSTAPSANFGGALFIPDDQSQCFTSEILVTGFLAGQEIIQESDLINFFINFEHSYMGDLTLTFLCPNGQSLLVHANQGAGTFLGEPVDDDGAPDLEGVGYDYYWAPDATLGTWGEESGGTLASGTYSSESPWSNLIGCPLNGIWAVEICDNLGSDNGFIFDWSLAFDPSLYPENLSFTPSIGADCDSTFWTVNDGPIATLEDCNDMVTEFTEAGEYLYTFHAMDNHGCEYTTDVNVEVSELAVSADGDFTICPGQSVSMNSSVGFNNSVLPNIVYEWTPGVFLTADDNVNPDVSDVTGVTTYTFMAYPAGFPECASSTEITVIPIDSPVADIAATEWCPGDQSILSAVNTNLLDSVNWTLLDPLEGLGNEPSLITTEGGTFVLTAFGCGIQVTDTLVVQEVPCDVFIPNIFTPNGDEFNNTFQIEGIEFQDNAHLVVYNRWGGIVFEDTKYDGLWDPKGGEVSDGTYFYVLTLESGEAFDGTITILR
jgi:gliding motility-associated-like protein